MKKLIKPLIFIAIVIAVVVLDRFTGLSGYLTFENLVENKQLLAKLVADNFAISVVIYVVVYTLAVGLSIPGATMLTLAGGFLYGTLFGIVFVNMGATGGAFIAFFAARYFLGGSLQDKYGEKLKKFNAEFDANGHNYLIMLRLMPVFPFFLINLLAGLTTIKVRTFIWTTSLGIIPGSAVYAFAGSQLETINTPKDILSFNIVLAFVVLGLFSVIPVLVKKLRKKRVAVS